MGGHHSTEGKTVVWLTPPHILEALGEFDLDPCACAEPRPWPTAREHFTERENGLIRPWHGRVFVNPPYGTPKTITPWLLRAAEHGNGCALIFARTETEVFFETVWRRASGILFLEGRLWFHRPDGSRGDTNAGAPSCIVAYGAEEAERLARAPIPGHFVKIEPRPGSQGSLL